MNRIFGYVEDIKNKSINNIGSYKLNICCYNSTKQLAESKGIVFTSKSKLAKYVSDNNISLVNATIHKHEIKGDRKSYALYFRQYTGNKGLIEMLANQVRNYFEEDYGTETDLCGYCIEASEILSTIFHFIGLKSRTVEGWCEFDDEYYGSDRPYDPHTWVEIDTKGSNKPIYVDITADQFNPGMYRENYYSPVTISIGLPHGMCYDEPVIYD